MEFSHPAPPFSSLATKTQENLPTHKTFNLLNQLGSSHTPRTEVLGRVMNDFAAFSTVQYSTAQYSTAQYSSVHWDYLLFRNDPAEEGREKSF